jgi:hypothetical protein
VHYRVKHKETGEERTLSHLDVNDMVYDDDGNIIVFDSSMQVYTLLDNEISS